MQIDNFKHLIGPVTLRKITRIVLDKPTDIDVDISIVSKDFSLTLGKWSDVAIYVFNTKTKQLTHNNSNLSAGLYKNLLPNATVIALVCNINGSKSEQLIAEGEEMVLTLVYVNEQLQTKEFKFKITKNTKINMPLYPVVAGALFTDYNYMVGAPDGQILDKDDVLNNIELNSGNVGGFSGDLIYDNSLNAHDKIFSKSISNRTLGDKAINSRVLDPKGFSDFSLNNFKAGLSADRLNYPVGVETGFIGTTKDKWGIGERKLQTTENVNKKITVIRYKDGSVAEVQVINKLDSHLEFTNKHDDRPNMGGSMGNDLDTVEQIGADRMVTKDFETGSVLITNKPNIDDSDVSKSIVSIGISEARDGVVNLSFQGWQHGQHGSGMKEIPVTATGLQLGNPFEDFPNWHIKSESVKFTATPGDLLLTTTIDQSGDVGDVKIESAREFRTKSKSNTQIKTTGRTSRIEIITEDDGDIHISPNNGDNTGTIHLETRIQNIQSRNGKSQTKSMAQIILDINRPIGSTYTQYPTESGGNYSTPDSQSPNTIFNRDGVSSTWVEQYTDKGFFFRTRGGNSNDQRSSNGIQDYATKNHQHEVVLGSHQHYYVLRGTDRHGSGKYGSGDNGTVGNWTSFTDLGTKITGGLMDSLPSSVETRTINVVKKVFLRTH